MAAKSLTVFAHYEATGDEWEAGIEGAIRMGADDVEAVGKVMRGDILPPNGNHFFLVDAAGIATVMRKCDRSVVARIPAETLAVAGRRRPARLVG